MNSGSTLLRISGVPLLTLPCELRSVLVETVMASSGLVTLPGALGAGGDVSAVATGVLPDHPHANQDEVRPAARRPPIG